MSKWGFMIFSCGSNLTTSFVHAYVMCIRMYACVSPKPKINLKSHQESSSVMQHNHISHLEHHQSSPIADDDWWQLMTIVNIWWQLMTIDFSLLSINDYLGYSMCRGDNHPGKNFVPPINTRSSVVELVKLMAWRQASSLMKIPVC